MSNFQDTDEALLAQVLLQSENEALMAASDPDPSPPPPQPASPTWASTDVFFDSITVTFDQ